MLTGNQPEPSREVARPAEFAHVRRERGDCHGADRTDPRHRLKLAGDIALLRSSGDALVQPFDFGTEPGDLLKIEPPHVSDQVGNVLFIETHGETSYIADALAQNDAVLGEMTAKRINQLRALSDEQIARAEKH